MVKVFLKTRNRLINRYGGSNIFYSRPVKTFIDIVCNNIEWNYSIKWEYGLVFVAICYFKCIGFTLHFTPGPQLLWKWPHKACMCVRLIWLVTEHKTSTTKEGWEDWVENYALMISTLCNLYFAKPKIKSYSLESSIKLFIRTIHYKSRSTHINAIYNALRSIN
jgi:hypothetical protein